MSLSLYNNIGFTSSGTSSAGSPLFDDYLTQNLFDNLFYGYDPNANRSGGRANFQRGQWSGQFSLEGVSVNPIPLAPTSVPASSLDQMRLGGVSSAGYSPWSNLSTSAFRDGKALTYDELKAGALGFSGHRGAVQTLNAGPGSYGAASAVVDMMLRGISRGLQQQSIMRGSLSSYDRKTHMAWERKWLKESFPTWSARQNRVGSPIWDFAGNPVRTAAGMKVITDSNASEILARNTNPARWGEIGYKPTRVPGNPTLVMSHSAVAGGGRVTTPWSNALDSVVKTGDLWSSGSVTDARWAKGYRHGVVGTPDGSGGTKWSSVTQSPRRFLSSGASDYYSGSFRTNRDTGKVQQWGGSQWQNIEPTRQRIHSGTSSSGTKFYTTSRWGSSMNKQQNYDVTKPNYNPHMTDRKWRTEHKTPNFTGTWMPSYETSTKYSTLYGTYRPRTTSGTTWGYNSRYTASNRKYIR